MAVTEPTRITLAKVLNIAPKAEQAYTPAEKIHKERRAQYYDAEGNKIASSRTTADKSKKWPPGTWRIDDWFGSYGRPIEQIRMVPVDELLLPEGDYTDPKYNPEGRRFDAERYAKWAREGKAEEIPPISVSKLDEGQ
jgi:hypothetical protein